MKVWLDSDEKSSIVSEKPNPSFLWTDNNVHASKTKFDFSSLDPSTSSKYKAEFGKLVKEAKSKDPTNPNLQSLEGISSELESRSSYIPSTSSKESEVSFPAPLLAPSFSVPRTSTLFFVVSPSYLSGKVPSFQTFFSVGSSKFHFNHFQVSWQTKDNADNVIESKMRQSKGHVVAGEKSLVAYRWVVGFFLPFFVWGCEQFNEGKN